MSVNCDCGFEPLADSAAPIGLFPYLISPAEARKCTYFNLLRAAPPKMNSTKDFHDERAPRCCYSYKPAYSSYLRVRFSSSDELNAADSPVLAGYCKGPRGRRRFPTAFPIFLQSPPDFFSFHRAADQPKHLSFIQFIFF